MAQLQPVSATCTRGYRGTRLTFAPLTLQFGLGSNNLFSESG